MTRNNIDSGVFRYSFRHKYTKWPKKVSQRFELIARPLLSSDPLNFSGVCREKIQWYPTESLTLILGLGIESAYQHAAWVFL